jgi:hypothetical protein
VRKVFEISIQPSAISIQPNQQQKQREKELRQGCHKTVEWHFSFCFQQNVLPPGGAKKIARIAKIGNRRNWKANTRFSIRLHYCELYANRAMIAEVHAKLG